MDVLLRQQMETLFNPNSVAVFASFPNTAWGLGVVHRLIGSQRRVYPITENVAEVLGVKAYPSIAHVPGTVDVAVIALTSSKVPAILGDCKTKGVKAALLITAGLAETGEKGQDLEQEILGIARGAGIRFVGPNSMGYLDNCSGVSTLAWVSGVNKGEVGLLCQSGTYGIRLLQKGTAAGIGFSKFVSCGNEADLYLEDYLEFLAEDKETRVIAAYIEGLREGKRFFELARRVTLQKPILVMKVARTVGAAKAARSHTAAVAGVDSVYDAMFRQAGVIRVEDDDELIDTTFALCHMPLPKSRKVGILTNGGGIGVVASDTCEQAGLELPTYSSPTLERLDSLLPFRWSHGNPADMTDVGSKGEMVVFPCLWAIMEDENVDMMLLIGGVEAPLGGDWLEHMPEAAELMASRTKQDLKRIDRTVEKIDREGKPLVVSRLTPETEADSEVMEKFRESGIPVLPNPRRAAVLLRHLAWYGEYLAKHKKLGV
jgi:acetyltransferase